VLPHAGARVGLASLPTLAPPTKATEMKKGHTKLKEWIILQYLDSIKDSDALMHDLICVELGIEILPHKIRTGIPPPTWRILHSALPHADADKEPNT
jgi:hypothetical protein